MDEASKDRLGRRSLGDWIGDVAMFIGSARTDARLDRLRRGGASGTQAPGCHEAAAFDQLYRETDGDPWRISTSGASYQAFKYGVLLACLPCARFAHALDLGCGAGVLTQRLAERCDAISGVDISAVAIALARTRAYACPTVFEASRAEVFLAAAEPCAFDLIVVADTFYYLAQLALDEAALDRLVLGLARLVRSGGYVVVANHHVPVEVDHASRVAGRVHASMARSPAFRTVSQTQRPFFIVGVFQVLGPTAPAQFER